MGPFTAPPFNSSSANLGCEINNAGIRWLSKLLLDRHMRQEQAPLMLNHSHEALDNTFPVTDLTVTIILVRC